MFILRPVKSISASISSLFKRLGNTPDGVTPVPWRVLSLIMLINLVDGMCSTFLFPFLAFMVTDLFNYPKSSIGFIGGWITCMYFLAQTFSSIILGQVSDAYGRRPIILLGISGNVITTITFGLSRHLWMALISRLMSGFLNGNNGVTKSYIREISDHTNQSKSFSYRTIGYAFGTILGPVIGGTLAQPAKNFPNYFSGNGLFGYFPFLLPSILISISSLSILILAFFFLEESLNNSGIKKVNSVDSFKLQETGDVLDENKSYVIDGNSEDADGDESRDIKFKVNSLEADNNSSNVLNLDTNHLYNISNDENSLENKDTENLDYLDANMLLPIKNENIQPNPSSLYQKIIKQLKLFAIVISDRLILRTILIYSGISFTLLGYDEVFSFWAASSPEKGGIGFVARKIGITNAFQGVGIFFTQLFIYVPIERRIGTRSSLLIYLLLVSPVIFLVPFSGIFLNYTALLWIYICLLTTCKSGFGVAAFVAINIMANNASIKNMNGITNGASASAASMARILAPVVGGYLYQWTSNSGLPFPFDYHFVFLFISVLTILMAIITHLFLPTTLDTRRVD